MNRREFLRNANFALGALFATGTAKLSAFTGLERTPRQYYVCNRQPYASVPGVYSSISAVMNCDDPPRKGDKVLVFDSHVHTIPATNGAHWTFHCCEIGSHSAKINIAGVDVTRDSRAAMEAE